MLPLLKPWNSGRGIMVGYNSTPEIDNHFLVIAAELVGIWRSDAGFHPEIIVDEVTGSDILAVVVFIVSLHLKHLHFISLAAKKYPEISISQSLTIWTDLDELLNDISEFSGMEKQVISKVFTIISLKSKDVEFLRKSTSKFMPLIIDLENGFVLRPVSSTNRNPLYFISKLIESRDPKFRHEISKPREKWLRTDIYALFGGSRYQRIKGSIKLRDSKKIVTDIDAAVYDNITGELALFQIKWQDFFVNDVKKLRSKASNLAREIDGWANEVSKWIKRNGTSTLNKSLRLKKVDQIIDSNIYLFGISKNAIRVQGYGYEIKADDIAIANWAQFVRNRNEIGPTDKVISNIHKALKKQEHDTISTNPMPIEISFDNKSFYYKDLWNSIEE